MRLRVCFRRRETLEMGTIARNVWKKNLVKIRRGNLYEKLVCETCVKILIRILTVGSDDKMYFTNLLNEP